MKKSLSLLFASMMAFALAMPVFAADSTTATTPATVSKTHKTKVMKTHKLKPGKTANTTTPAAAPSATPNK